MKRTLAIGILAALLGTRATASPFNIDVHLNINGHEHDFDFNLGDFHLGDLHIGHGGLFGSGILGDLLGDLHIGHGGLFGGGILGGGFLGLNNFEAQQTRFETRFADMQSDYDDGVANIEDFYSSDEYDDIVSDAKRISRRYDFFVDRVETSIDFLGTAIDTSNDSLDFVQDLLDDYKTHDLPEKRLARIEDILTNIQDNIQLRIDFLTEKQTTLSGNLPTYLDFQTQIGTFVDTIVAAGGDSSSSALSVLASVTVSTSASVAGQTASDAATVSPTSAVPEPSAILQTSIAVAAIGLLRRSPSRN